MNICGGQHVVVLNLIVHFLIIPWKGVNTKSLLLSNDSLNKHPTDFAVIIGTMLKWVEIGSTWQLLYVSKKEP